MQGAMQSHTNLLQELVSPKRSPIEEPVLIIVAHPDDETIGIGAQLPRLSQAILIHVTDGAPLDLVDAHRAGFETASGYAAARRAELNSALRVGGSHSITRIGLNISDQETPFHLREITRSLKEIIGQFKPTHLFTHPYEGGHPDHDTIAFCVACASQEISPPPRIIEMAFYHRGARKLRTGHFLSSQCQGGGSHQRQPVWVATLGPAETERKAKMYSCFATQSNVLSAFPRDTECFRFAPKYDFSKTPHPGILHYETLRFSMNGARLCQLMEDAVRSRQPKEKASAF